MDAVEATNAHLQRDVFHCIQATLGSAELEQVRRLASGILSLMDRARSGFGDEPLDFEWWFFGHVAEKWYQECGRSKAIFDQEL